MEGVIAPDIWKDYPHHYGKSEAIKKNILNARSFFLQNDLLNTYYHLGVALHYIQDSFTTCPSYLDRHHKWEEGIEKCYYSADLGEIVQKYVDKRDVRKRYLRLAQELSTEAQGKDDALRVATLNGQTKTVEGMTSPMVDLNFGYTASYLVSKAVLGLKYSPELDISLRRLLEDHERRLVSVDMASANSLIDLIEKRDELSTRIASPSSLAGKIKNWLTGRKLKAIERAVATEHDDYINRQHLGRVAARYNAEAEMIASRYGGWYRYEVPSLGIDNVSLELIGIHDAAAISLPGASCLQGLNGRKESPDIPESSGNEMVRRADLARAQIDLPPPWIQTHRADDRCCMMSASGCDASEQAQAALRTGAPQCSEACPRPAGDHFQGGATPPAPGAGRK